MARIKRVHLYFDDSGVRRPDHNPQEHQRDQMDHFALGGILIHEEEIGALIATHRALNARFLGVLLSELGYTPKGWRSRLGM
jgi:hypothetical protein